MSCEGVWKVEVKGPYGWERVGTAFMRNGEYLGASANHYSIGTYKEDGKNLELSIALKRHGNLSYILGSRTVDKVQLISKCEIHADEITGTLKAEGIENFDVLICLTRLGSLE